MKQIINVILLLFIVFINISLSANNSSKHQIKSEEDAFAWLNRFGYNPCLNSEVQCSLSFPSLLEIFQKRFHLKVTGKLDQETKQQMGRPRCGNEDKEIAELNSQARRWSRSSLKYSIRSYPTQISEGNTRYIIHEAFQAWLVHIPLQVEETCSTCAADIVLEFEYEQHSDGYPFDGIGGRLAHAYFPEDGRVHFDKDEAWTESFNDYQTNLFLVAVHELGHALGLEHSYDKNSIMYALYERMPKNKILPDADRYSIQALYGMQQPSTQTPTTTRFTTRKNSVTTTKRKSITTTKRNSVTTPKRVGVTTTKRKSITTTKRNSVTTPKRVGVTTTKRKSITTTKRNSVTTPKSSGTVLSGKPHPRCRLFLDAAFGHPDGTLHTFNAGILWRYLSDENTWEDRASKYKETYSNLPNRVAAGAYNCRTKEVAFFTGTHVYHYVIDNRNRAKFQNQALLARNLHNSIFGAIYYRGEIYVITRKTIRLFKLDNGYQQSNGRDLSKEFPGFTGIVTTAFSNGGLHHFFTTDRLVYIWSERLNTWQTFGKPMETNWFACSGTETYITNDNELKQLVKHRSSHHHHHRPQY